MDDIVLHIWCISTFQVMPTHGHVKEAAMRVLVELFFPMVKEALENSWPGMDVAQSVSGWFKPMQTGLSFSKWWR